MLQKFHYRFSAFRSFFAVLSEVAEVGEGTGVPDLQLGKKESIIFHSL